MQNYNFKKISDEIYTKLIKKEEENDIKFKKKLSSINPSTLVYYEFIENERYNINLIDSNKKIIGLKFINKKIIGLNKDNLLQRKKIVEMYFKYDEFRECHFENVEFINCIFIGNKFLNCEFKNVEFINCKFYKDKESVLVIDDNTTFIECKFRKCDIRKALIKNVKVYNIKFINTDLREVIMSDCKLNNIKITDCDCRSLKIIKISNLKLYFEDNNLTRFDEYTFIDNINFKNKDKDLYIDMYKIYKSVSLKFKANGLLNSSDEYYYLAKCIEFKGLEGNYKFKSAIFWLLCGYGERPTFALITSLEIVILFAVLYMITGLNIGGDIISYNEIMSNGINFNSVNNAFMNSIYFSIVTFTTVGYGDITPIGMSVFLSGIEMLLGVTMVGIWTATLARKITR